MANAGASCSCTGHNAHHAGFMRLHSHAAGRGSCMPQAAWCTLPAQPGSQSRRRSAPITRAEGVATSQGTADLVPLGQSALRVSRLGIGTLQWGDPKTGFGQQYDEAGLAAVFDAAVAGGVNFFDTAEVYGYQGGKASTSSEHLLGRCLARPAATAAAAAGRPMIAGTKFFPVPWTNMLVGGGVRLSARALLDALRASLARLGVEKADLYQVHFPFPAFSQPALAEALTEAVAEGLAGAVGVCNYDAAQMEQIHGLLAARGVPLASNQVKYSLLERGPEQKGLLKAAAGLGVSIVAHSPLAQGRLTGKYLDSERSESDPVRALLKLMQFIGAVSGGKTVTQVALNYLMQKGAIPIPGCKTAEQAQEHVGALGWALEENELAILDEKLASLKL